MEGDRAMRAFTLISSGIPCREGKIQVGESGRGRHLAEVPVPKGGEFSEDGKLLVIAIPGEQPGEALVFVPDLSGFRGSSSIREMTGCIEFAKGFGADGIA